MCCTLAQMVIRSHSGGVRLDFVACICACYVASDYYYFLIRRNLISSDFMYVKFVGYNLRISRRHVCNCWLLSAFYVVFSDVFVASLHTRFHSPSSNGSLVITIKSKDIFRATAVLLLCSTKDCLSRSCVFFKDTRILPLTILGRNIKCRYRVTSSSFRPIDTTICGSARSGWPLVTQQSREVSWMPVGPLRS
jgi:hypothetical protein